MTLKIAARTVSVSDLLRLAFYSESALSGGGEAPQALRDVLEDNKRLHYFFGLDNEQSVTWEYRGWTITGVPDQILEDRVIEGKVVRKNSRPDKLLAYALVQGFIYARALGVELIEVILFNPMRKVVYQGVFSVEKVEALALPVIDRALDAIDHIVRASETAKEATKKAVRLIGEELGKVRRTRRRGTARVRALMRRVYVYAS